MKIVSKSHCQGMLKSKSLIIFYYFFLLLFIFGDKSVVYTLSVPFYVVEIRGIKQSLDICVVLNHFIEVKNVIVKLYCF